MESCRDPFADEFEIAQGSETNGSVNWTTAVYERVGEFGALLLGAGAERVRSLPQRLGDGAKQRVGLSFAVGHNPLAPTAYRKAPAACAPGLSVNYFGGEIPRWSLSSPTWTRTKNLAVNSRSLYRLSYRGTRSNPNYVAVIGVLSTGLADFHPDFRARRTPSARRRS